MNEPIQIIQVANGFYVRGSQAQDILFEGPRTHDVNVFRSMSELLLFVAQHFDHRDVVDANDDVRKCTAPPEKLITGRLDSF